jgi:hypothetical protein
MNSAGIFLGMTGMNDAFRNQEYIPVLLLSPERERAIRLFNPNAYPGDLRTIVEDCSTALAVFETIHGDVTYRIGRGLNLFREQVNHQLSSGMDTLLSAGKPVTIVYDDVVYISLFRSFLLSLKAFLDVYAKLVFKLHDRAKSTTSFKKAKIFGDEISGGELIKWLSARGSPNAKLLSKTLEFYSRAWITSAVGYRDRVQHHGEIPRMRHMQVDLKRYIERQGHVSAIDRPALPDGSEVTTYVHDVTYNLRRFLRDSIALLPEVDLNLVELNMPPWDPRGEAIRGAIDL